MATRSASFGDGTVSIGRVFQRSFSTIAHNPAVVLGLTVLLGVIPSFLMLYLFTAVGIGAADPNLSSGYMWGMAFALMLSMSVSFAISAIVQGALTRATVAESEGHRASFGECLSVGLRYFLPLIGAGIIFGFGITFGMLLLIVPGVILALMWCVAAPAVVIERNGVFAALRRSSELTKGSRWKILGLFIVLAVAYWLLLTVLGVVGLGTASSTAELTAGTMVGTIVMGTLFNAVWGTLQPSLYIELRRSKEGDSVEALQDVFA